MEIIFFGNRRMKTINNDYNFGEKFGNENGRYENIGNNNNRINNGRFQIGGNFRRMPEMISNGINGNDKNQGNIKWYNYNYN